MRFTKKLAKLSVSLVFLIAIVALKQLYNSYQVTISERIVMLTLQITKEQVFDLIEQLSPDEQKEILQYLIQKSDYDPDDTPDEIVIQGIKEGLQQAINGETIPLSQMWDGIDV